ncbi:hypothetical protein V6N13_128507 [Hibiscus sabdariffa]|uniref:Uncharacterized protein n=1 Tax=Hibiscus sabdariffa TaxID=183260 RepID=A0ABR2P0P5_9ROSI
MDGEEDASNLMMEANGTGGVDEAPLSSTTTRRNRPIISGEPLDIEAYAGLYTGRTKINRLIFIASHCDNPAMQLEALMKSKRVRTRRFTVKWFRRLKVDWVPTMRWILHGALRLS